MKIPTLLSTRRLLFLLFLFLSQNATVLLQAQETTAQEETTLDPSELDSLTDEELELICVERGFELVQDDIEDGELSHEDYVDAARRCLAIEQDMNEILEQNPELADELVAEIDRMKQEKERLERDQQQMLVEKERLEQQLKAKESGGGSSRMWGGPLEDGTPPSAGAKQSAFGSADSGTASNGGDEDATASVPVDASTTGNATSDEEEEDDLCSNPTTTPSSSSASSTNSTTDFSLAVFVQEILTEFEKDVHRVTSLLLPVLKPLYKTGNRALNYVKALFQGARHHYKKYKNAQQQKQPPNEGPKDKGIPLEQLAGTLGGSHADGEALWRAAG